MITGSSRGIGKVLAIKLADEGASIVVTGRTEVEADLPGTIGETAAAIEKIGSPVIAVKLDLADDASIDAAIDAAIAKFGRIDILVNNAVIVGRRLPFPGGNPDFLDVAYRVNVRAPYRMTQRVTEIMAENGGGTVINITSEAAHHAKPPTAPITANELDSMDPSYGITKAALERMTTAYASELFGKNIAIVAVAPGLVITERIAKASIRRNVNFDSAESSDVIADAVAVLAKEGMKHTGRLLFGADFLAELAGEHDPSGLVRQMRSE
jgi:NAD(P)-dependent dehydrogenase (short-subunit alcohol dehydrogenase family)